MRPGAEQAASIMTTEHAPSPAAGDVEAPRTATVDEQIASIGTSDVVVALLTYNNAETLPGIVEAATCGIRQSLSEVTAAFVNVDAGSSDGSPALIAAGGLPT